MHVCKSTLTSLTYFALKAETAMTMSQYYHNYSTQRESDPPNVPLNDVVGAQFYFMDRFILIGAGSEVCLHKYLLDTKGMHACTCILFIIILA